MVEVYAEKCPNYSTVTHWVRKFKSGFLSVMDEPREGRPTSVVTEKNVSTVEGLVKQDRRITVKQLASETRISVGSVEKILHDHLNLNKVSARWVPRLLTADQKKERADCCKHLLRLEANDDLFFQKIVTMDETWIYQFDPSTIAGQISLALAVITQIRQTHGGRCWCLVSANTNQSNQSSLGSGKQHGARPGLPHNSGSSDSSPCPARDACMAQTACPFD
ncbi:hypothetical protein EGW08_019360 [Elysia chlorotica]|uniref:Mos1 transposase HTH domain-containing protein n=1 Tax=Elysia chlorotica TaxID=188477 RepID=A0A433SUN8_ELYCH|nr:hypothetical protein EGW08_019360 [Elysia chlorotica]